MFRAVFLTTFALFTLPAAAGHAQTLAQSDKRIAVSYSDLNISRPEGAQVLITRMRAAARQVCGPAPDQREFTFYRLYRDCVEDALSRAVVTLNDPLVTELYRSGTSTRVAGAN